LPLVVACAAAFVLTGARIAADPGTRLLDVALLASLAAIVFQAIPLPGSVATILSPATPSLASMLHLEPQGPSWSLSIDARVTRQALMHAAAPVFLFWAAREVFARGGVRVAARVIAWTGLAVTMVALAQRATAPGMLLWRWRPADPGSQPFGPFANPNHFAAWLIMAGALTAGYLIAHRRSHRSEHSSRRLIVRDWLADGSGLVLAAALVVMLLGIAATLSRAAIAAAFIALAATALALRTVVHTGRGLRLATSVVAVVLGCAVWANRDGLARKFDAATTVSRMEIWRDTAPAIGAFWVSGTGAGTYSQAMLRYQQATPEFHFNQAHSEYVQLAAEGGLLLSLPVLVALGAGVSLARRLLQRDLHEVFWVRAGAAAGLAALAVQSIFETPLRAPANALLAALLAAVVLHQRNRHSSV
jgi:hypothetical protein